MFWRHTFAICALVLLQAATAHFTGHAQPIAPQAAQQAPLFEDIRAAIIKVIGAQDQEVAASVAGNIFLISRINSNMNKTSHGARNNEAAAIGPVVSKAIAGKPEFNNIHTIRVEYLARPASAGDATIIDIVDFRKDPTGAFQFHMT